MATPAEEVRARLKRRRSDSESRVVKIPFVVDPDLANRAERLARRRDETVDDLAALEAQIEDRDAEAGPDDTRADGRDMSDIGRKVEAYREKLALLDGELAEVVEALQEGSVMIEFRLATKGEYERILIEVEQSGGEVGVEQAPTIRFGDNLMSLTFIRVHKDGEDLGYKTWDEFADDMQLTFGDVDPIRTIVYAKNHQTGAMAVPFSLPPSRRTGS